MSDIEDEVKCSECPNARHGFDRDASHNEGRYVCQCESHKCTAESLRQQLEAVIAERDQWKNDAVNGGNAAYLRQQLAEKEAQIVRLTNLVEKLPYEGENMLWELISEKKAVLSFPQDTAALEAMIVKAGDVMRERCAVECETHYNFSNALAAAIRALPAVTLEDLK